ncbi:MAG: low molecular weight protein-tyrosine-phosphatase [Anaerolineales bacterium]
MIDKKNVLFVCTGNIIRSPLAEHMLRQLAEDRGVGEAFHIASAGTSSYHTGQAPDSRMRQTAAEHGLEYTGSARQLDPTDLEEFDLIIAMDRSNQRNIQSMAQTEEHRSKIHFMREWDPEANGDMDVPDPYYGGLDGFERTYQIVARSVENLFRDLDQGTG